MTDQTLIDVLLPRLYEASSLLLRCDHKQADDTKTDSY